MAQIQFPSMVPCIIVGGAVMTDLDNLIELSITNDSNASQKYSTYRLSTGTSGYVVPASKTFYCRAVSFLLISAAAASKNAYVGYADADAGISGSAPSGATYWGSSAGASYVLPANINGTAQNPKIEMQFGMTIPTGKYPFFTFSSGLEGQGKLYGYAR